MAAVPVPIRRFALAGLPAAVLLGFLAPTSPALAQTVRVAAEQEVFRQTADGKRLATVMKDTELAVVGREGGWTEVRLEGWIWSRSVAPTTRGGFDLVVSAQGGENLRESPGGRIAARLLRGFLLEKVEEGGDWIRVRRTGWVWGPSLGPERPVAAGGGRPASAGPGGDESPAAAGGEPSLERIVVAASPVRMHVSPDGDTTAVLRSGADLRVLERRDRWARVRLEGWVPAAELATAEADPAEADLSAADLRANPEQYVGARVRWSVQFISLERAEAVRTDFYEGEPFILARAPDPSHGFVYLAVPPELLARVEKLEGLETIEVVARVRTGRSVLMGVPILDLQTLY